MTGDRQLRSWKDISMKSEQLRSWKNISMKSQNKESLKRQEYLIARSDGSQREIG